MCWICECSLYLDDYYFYFKASAAATDTCYCNAAQPSLFILRRFLNAEKYCVWFDDLSLKEAEFKLGFW